MNEDSDIREQVIDYLMESFKLISRILASNSSPEQKLEEINSVVDYNLRTSAA